MNDRLNFESFIYGDSFAQAKKDKQRELIARHTEEFLANGGEITYLPYDPTAEMAARVGRWNSLGEMGNLSTEDGGDNESYVSDFIEPYY